MVLNSGVSTFLGCIGGLDKQSLRHVWIWGSWLLCQRWLQLLPLGFMAVQAFLHLVWLAENEEMEENMENATSLELYLGLPFG